MKTLLLSLSSFLTVATCFAEAATIHVSTSGSDATGTGASSAPFATIQKAVDASQNGDVVLVAPGTYSGEGNRAINLRGKQILLRSIAGPIQTIVDLGQRQGLLAHSTETLATVVDGFTFQNGYVESGEDWRGDGIVSILGDSAITLRNCIFRNNETRATSVTTTTGIVVKRDRSSLEIARVENCLFYSNTIGGGGWTGVGGGQAVVVGVCGGEPAIKLIDVVNSTIANNTLYRSASGADGIRIPVSAGTVKNSIIWGNGDGFFPPTSSYPAPYQTGAQTEVFTQIDYSISEKGAVLSAGAVGNVMTSNPLFTDASNGDFTLATGSPAINAGDPSLENVDGSRLNIGFSIERALAGFDADGDEVNNYREARDGTDPNDSESFNLLSKGLVAYYLFNGSLSDDAGLANNLGGESYLSFEADRAGGVGNALRFVNSSAYAESVREIGITGNQSRTVSFWVKLDAGAYFNNSIVSFGDGSSATRGNTLHYSVANGARFQMWGSWLEQSTAEIEGFDQSQWHQIVYVHNGSVSQSKFYIDGQSVGTLSGDHGNGDAWDTGASKLSIGNYTKPGNQYNFSTASMALDDLRVYNRALSASEVGQLYQTEAGDFDTDGDGIRDAYETDTGVYVSPTNTGTDPNKADTDGDGLTDGVETATFIYIDASDTGTDPNVVDSDADGLSDGVETNTGIYVGEGNTGTSPVDEDTSNDGISDGEAVLWKFNPHIDCTPMMNFLRYASETGTSGRFGLFTSNSITDLNLGGLVLQKSGTGVFLRLQLQTKAAMSQSWSNHSIVPMFLDMPGNKTFMRVRALGQQ